MQAKDVVMRAWNRTKIVCTFGPATDAPGVLEALACAGMSVARMNLSHGEHAEHARRIAEVREGGARGFARRRGRPAGGNPELLAALRVGEPVYLADGAIELRVALRARHRRPGAS
ncbi:MAG TPA: pyruvate kinase [Burkholderiales bacterium]